MTSGVIASHWRKSQSSRPATSLTAVESVGETSDDVDSSQTIRLADRRRCGAVAISLTDWPLGWHFWLDHPLDAALVAGFLVVLVTAAALDTYLRSRESRRWRSVGRAAAAEFSHVFDQAVVGMLSLLGFDVPRPRQEIESALAEPRARAQALLDLPPGDPAGLLQRQRDPADRGDDGWQRERLEILIHDAEWLKGCHETLVAIGQLQLALISRWVSSFAILNDDGHLARVERALRLIEAERALDSSLFVVGDDRTEAQTDDAIGQWSSLVADLRREANYWYLRYQEGAEIPDIGPRRREAERDRELDTNPDS